MRSQGCQRRASVFINDGPPALQALRSVFQLFGAKASGLLEFPICCQSRSTFADLSAEVLN